MNGVFEKEDVFSYLRDFNVTANEVLNEHNSAMKIKLTLFGSILSQNNSVITYKLNVEGDTSNIDTIADEIANKLYDKIGSNKVLSVTCTPSIDNSYVTLVITGPDIVAQGNKKMEDKIMRNSIKVKSNEIGKCPVCNSMNLDYVVTEAIDYKSGDVTVTTAEDDNATRGYYGNKMTKRDKVRSYDQALRNLDRMKTDKRVTDGQVVDQMQFGSPLTDIEKYKIQKDLAKKAQDKGDTIWQDEHNRTAKVFADKIRNKHIDKKQEDIDDDIDDEDTSIDVDNTISLLDIALKEVPSTGVEDWGKDDELLFTADTVKLFEHLKEHEEEIPKYYYDNSASDDWSNGIDDYLSDMLEINPNSGEGNNTYNWNAPLTHHFEYTTYDTDNGYYVKVSIHRDGDVRGNYTTEFLLSFDSADEFFSEVTDISYQYLSHTVKLDNNEYTVVAQIFSEYVDISLDETDEQWYDVYCPDIATLKQIVSKSPEE